MNTETQVYATDGKFSVDQRYVEFQNAHVTTFVTWPLEDDDTVSMEIKVVDEGLIIDITNEDGDVEATFARTFAELAQDILDGNL